MPRLSIVVPVYNVEKYLDQTIQSIISQDFEDFEAIFVDDGSPDSSPAILDCAAAQNPNKIRVIHLADNRGTHFARKTGVAAARGEFLTFLDGDDYFLPHAFARMVEAAEETPADILRFSVDFPEESPLTEEEKNAKRIWQNHAVEPIWGTENILRERLLADPFIANSVWGVIYPTAFLKKVFAQMTDERITFAEDIYEMFFLMHAAQSFRKHPAVVYCYRLGTGISFNHYTLHHITERLIAAKNMARSFSQFSYHPMMADYALAYPQNMVKSAADIWLQMWQQKLNQTFGDDKENPLYQMGHQTLCIRVVTRAEKVGNLVLLPLRKIRAVVWKIEEKPTGKTLLRPLRFLWRQFYATGRAFYRFLRDFKNPR